MKYEEIIKLLDAGYTREEILAMGSEPEDPTPEDPTPEDPKPEDVKSVSEEIANAMEDMRTAFEGFKKEIQAMNIMNSQIDPPESYTAEDLIGKIINPFDNNDKKG